MFIFCFFVDGVVVSLCCYVVKLGKGNNKKKKKKHPKIGSTSGYLLQDKLWLHVQKLLFVFWSVLLFLPCCFQNTIKISFLVDFEKLILRFFGQKSRSITWPNFGQKFAQKCGQVIDLEVFTCFFACIFFENLIHPAKIKRLFEKKTMK